MADLSRSAWSPPRFVPLPENRSALLAIRRMARALERQLPRAAFVPLLIHGPPGCGKSHLADALHERAAMHGAIERRDAADWAARDDIDGEPLRRCHLLIVEDLQHLPAKAAGTFGVLLDERGARRRLTLLTASKGPADLVQLPARLASRLVGGLVVGIAAPDLAGRRRLLAGMADAKGIALTAEALDWLARHTPGSGRQLQGALQRLRGLPLPPDAETVQALFEAEGRGEPLTLELILRLVGRHFHVAPEALQGRDRQPGVLLPRQWSMYLARELTALSLAQIGAAFGRDHTTVGHACKKLAALVENDVEYAARARQLRAELAG